MSSAVRPQTVRARRRGRCEDLNLATSHTFREHVFLDLPLTQCPKCEMISSLHQWILLDLCDTRSLLAVDCVREEATLKSCYDGRPLGENDKPGMGNGCLDCISLVSVKDPRPALSLLGKRQASGYE